ncbi:recombinase family protein [Ferribacterium limneticum]|uniref:recombinase family protein n=1 Tax=Ferribacterium limneticum TaxID=76259 RepID=UPI001CF8BA08|nr:recombinase family protein [Ferribacterium limneticum]UCV26813.1 recombinase family protein [Ferribacterium limneticum]UCV30730.1 recombinase family protein [Ferribacterium limneticum]
MENRKVYSYLRFSAAKQATGTSIERQAEYALKWAESQGMVLDQTLTMKDEGLSAYHQKHVRSGALGLFLEAVTAGRIPTGSVLIVEGLDRLSRAEPIQAQAQLYQIINADITVVTSVDGKQYNRERLKANPMDLLYSLLVMIRAHEESETKSKRVAAAVLRRCQGWEAGTFRGKVPGGKDPSWVRWNGQAFELEPVMASAVKTAIQLYIEGNGPVRILQLFEEQGIPMTGSQRASNALALITKQPRLFIGQRPISTCGESFVLEGYYPPLLTAEEYARLLAAIAERKQAPRRAGGKSDYPSLFTGMSLAFCGNCGGKIVSCNSTRQFESGPSVYRWVRCTTCSLTASMARLKNQQASAGATAIEKAVLDYCSDQLNLDALLSGGGRDATLQAERALTAQTLAETEHKITKILDAALELDELPQALLRKAKELEDSLVGLRDRIHQLDAKVTAGEPAEATSLEWAALREGVMALDYDARLKCRQLIANTFSKVQFFFKGGRIPENCVDILLTSRTGVSRWLRIDRKTGQLVRGLELVK